MRFPALASLRRGWPLAAVAALIALAALLTGGPEPAQAHDGTEGHVHFAPFLDGCGSCPDAPTGYAEPGFRGVIKVHWTPATTGVAATSWHIRYTRVTDEDNPFNQPQNVTHISHPASARSYTISGLEPGVQYAVLIMGWGGNGYGDAAVASLAAGAVPLPGPPFFDARVTGDILRIRIKGDLDTGSVPAGSAFKVTASQYGVTRTINGSDAPIRSLDPVRILDASFANFRFTYVYVMLTESVRRGETVTVSYTRPTQNPLQDRSGNRHTYSFSNKPVTNRTPRDSSDTTPPTFTSAEVKKPSDRFAVTDTTLLVTFNQNLDLQAAGTAGSAFSVTVTNPNTGAARTIEGKGTVGTGERNNLGYLVPNQVANVTLDGRILRRETVTVSYTQPTENPLQDENGNPVATFTGRTVSNNVPLPMATGAQVMPNGQSQYNRLIVTFDQELDDNSSPASAFVMTSRYTLTRPIDGAQVEREHTHTGTGTLSISGRTLEVTLDSPMQPIAEFTVKYTKPSSGNKLRDTVHNEAPSFTLAQGSRANFVVCSAWGNYALSGDRAAIISPIPCDMAKPAWNFGEGSSGSIVWLYSEANPAPPVDQPVEFVAYTIPGRPDHRAVRDAQGDCYREERVNGQWQRSTSYGSNGESCRQASWNAYNRAMGLLMVNPDGGTFPSGPAPVVATLDSAAVNEKTLKLTFDRSLDAVSLPAPSAFTVTENGVRRSVAAGGVAVSGQTVTLTLTAAVDPGTKVTARYTKPTVNPLRTAANGIDVEGFTDQSVTNNTQINIWSATLTVSQGTLESVSGTPWTGCYTERATSCSSALTEDSFTAAGASYQVFGIIENQDSFTVVMNRAIPSAWTMHVDNRQYLVANAQHSENGGVHRHVWNSGGVWRAAGQQVSLRLTGPAPTLQSAAVEGTTLTMTFSENLDTASEPAPSAFTVTVNNAGRDVASDGVDISGSTVTLTLASQVSAVDTVKVGYTRPTAMPLKGVSSGIAVGTFTDRAVANNSPKVVFQSATVDGTTLTLTFDQSLDTTSEPAPGDFYVTVNDARRNVATENGVAISGAKVTLTLASAVAYGNTVKVRYTRPSTNPLQGGNGAPVLTFTDQGVTNDTAFWTATLTAGPSGQSGNGCRAAAGSSTLCNTALSDDDFTVGGTTYQVNILAAGVASDSLGFMELELDKEVPTTWTLYVGSNDGLAVSTATRSNGNKNARWHPVNWGIGNGDMLTVSLKAPPPTTTSTMSDSEDASGLTAQQQVQVPAVSVTGVYVVSDPGADKTYGIGDTIQVRVTFNQLVVDVDTSGGTPRIKIDMDPAEWGEKWASYASGSGTSALTFAHTVVEPNISTQGIAVLENTLELNGGTIRSDGEHAALSHTGQPHDANHKVDWQTESDTSSDEDGATGSSSGGDEDGGSGSDEEPSEPASVSKVKVSSSPQANSTYALGETISITLTFSEAVTVTGTPRLKIDMDPAEWGEKWASYASGSGTATLTFTHTVVEPNISTKGIAVLKNTLELNGGTIQASGVNADLTHTGLKHNAKHKVDWRPSTPTVTGVSITSDPGSDDTYGLGDVIRISVTFSEEVDVTGTPQLKIDMDPADWGEKVAAYESGSGTATLIFTHTVVEPNYSTQGIAVLLNPLTLNGGDIESSASDTDADLSHTGLAHNSEHKVDWQLSDEGGPGS